MLAEQLTYLKADLPKSDWLLQCKVHSTCIEFPCHSSILSNASSVLCGLNEVKPKVDEETIIPFPGDEKLARTFLDWIYKQQRILTTEEIPGLAKISHEWNIPGASASAATYVHTSLLIRCK